MIAFLQKSLRDTALLATLGAGLGSLAGVADFAQMFTRRPSALASSSPVFVLIYAAAGAICGVAFGTFLGLFGEGVKRRRAPLLVTGTIVLLALVAANLLLEHTWKHPVSLLVDGLILVASLPLWLLTRWLGPRLENPIPWAAFAMLAVLVTWALLPGAPTRPESVGETSPHPNVLILLVDTLRADHTSVYGYHRDTTPNLASFAREATVFERAHAASTWTKPSTATIFTGLPPAIHGVESTYDSLPGSSLGLSEVMAAADYKTGLFSDNPFVSRRFGFGQGFETVLDCDGWNTLERAGIPPGSLLERVVHLFYKGGRTRSKRSTVDLQKLMGVETLNSRFLSWLDGLDPTEPWFAHMHYMEPHWPYLPPEPFASRFRDPASEVVELYSLKTGLAPFQKGTTVSEETRQGLVNAYDCAIAYWDHEFGLLLDELSRRNQLEGTLILVLSDHGEGFYEHQTWDHGNSVHQELTHVPLLIRQPGGEAGRRCGVDVSLVSLPSTILLSAGFSPPDTMADPLLPLPSTSQSCGVRLVPERAEHVLILSRIQEGKKWVLANDGSTELFQGFDLDLDFTEREELALPEEDRERIRSAILRRNGAEERQRLSGEKVKLTPELEESLGALGYLR